MLWLFLPSLASAGFFSDHIKKYVDDSIQPCDDFYDHVCSSAVRDENFFWRNGAKQLQNVLRQVAAPEIRSFRELVMNNTDNFPNEPMEIEDIEAFDQFVGNTVSSCELKDSSFLEYFHFLDGFEAYDGFTRLKDTPHYYTLESKMSDIFSVLKDILVDEFKYAPWTKRYPELMDFLENVVLISLDVDDLQLDQKLEVLKQRYEKCIGITPNLTRTLSEKCSEFVLCSEPSLIAKILEFMGDAFWDTAGYANKTVMLSPLYFTLEEDDLPYMLGAVDFTISHELGHTFFSNETGALPSNSECFRYHILKTCNKLLNNTECDNYKSSYYNGRFGDDAADWVGVYGGLNALREYFPKIFNDESLTKCKPESTEIMKQFFYANAINWCARDPKVGDEEHSPNKIRVNGIVSLFPEFSEVFQCKRGSKMAKAATCLPFAGAGAPTKKRFRRS